MRVLIAYASKTGNTEECAYKIKGFMKTEAVDLIDLKKHHQVDLSLYDKVVIGTPLYMGQPARPFRQFVEKNTNELINKEMYLYVCGLARGQEGIDLLKKQVSPKLFDHAKFVVQLGGDVHLQKLNPIYKWMMKKILAESKPQLGLAIEEIEKFASDIES
jgi:menaquinone-dependent protoporphyrinogen oxidase